MERIGSSQHHSQWDFAWPLESHHALGHGRRNEGDGDLLRQEPVPEGLGLVPDGLIGQEDTRARREVGPEFPHDGIEPHGCELGGPVGRADLEGALVPEHQVQKARVSDLDAFGLAGGPGGIDDIGEVLRLDAGRWGSGRPGSAQVHREHPVNARDQSIRNAAASDQQWAACVTQDEGKPIAGVGRIEGKIRPAGLENCQCAHDHLWGALDAKPDDHFGTDTKGAQFTSKPIGLGIELLEGQRPARRDHRRRGWRLGCARAHQVRHALLSDVESRGLAPFGHPLPLKVLQHDRALPRHRFTSFSQRRRQRFQSSVLAGSANGTIR